MSEQQIYYLHLTYKGKRFNVGVTRKQLQTAFESEISFEQLIEHIINRIIAKEGSK